MDPMVECEVCHHSMRKKLLQKHKQTPVCSPDRLPKGLSYDNTSNRYVIRGYGHRASFAVSTYKSKDKALAAAKVCLAGIVDDYNKQYGEAKEKAEEEYQKELQEKNKEMCKKYRETHKEDIAAHKRKYYQNNKAKINEKKRQMSKCVCGKTYTGNTKSAHMKSNEHLSYVNEIVESI